MPTLKDYWRVSRSLGSRGGRGGRPVKALSSAQEARGVVRPPVPKDEGAVGDRHQHGEGEEEEEEEEEEVEEDFASSSSSSHPADAADTTWSPSAGTSFRFHVIFDKFVF